MSSFYYFLLFILLYILLIWKSGKTYPVLYLFLFTYFLQYLFSTYLIYNVYDELRVQMELDQETYFAYTNPAILCLFAGVFIFNTDLDIKGTIRSIDPDIAVRYGYWLLGISLLVSGLMVVGISGMASVNSLTNYLKYPAAFCFLFSRQRFHFAISGLIYLFLAASVLRGGVFIDFFIWSTYLFFFLVHRFEVSFFWRTMFIVIAAPLLIMVQAVKTEYRKVTWEGNKEGGVGLFTELAQKNTPTLDESVGDSPAVVKTVGRLTQGWHLGLTLKHTPAHEPFADGNELLTDIEASILPRLFYPNKKIIGSQDKFYQFTGHVLHGTTSMTIGVLGDFYINFGWVGSWVMLFVFGALISKGLYVFLIRYVRPDPINIVWVPYLLNYLIRANNDFYMVFNNMTKGFLIFLAVNYLQKRYLRKPTQLVVNEA